MATPATNISGSVSMNMSFSELISAGVIVSQNLPTGINQNLSYSNGTVAGAPGNVDLVYGRTFATNAAPTVLNFFAGTSSTSANPGTSDLAGNSYAWARMRELVIQNLGSVPLLLWGASASGMSWLPAASSNAIIIPPAQASASTNSYSSLSTIYPLFRMCDPTMYSANTGGMALAASSCLMTLLGSGSSITSVNLLAAGCSG